jgi:hypothetical protein
MTEERNPLEAAADLLVYAPVGLLVAARELYPTLVERGRTELGHQVNLARVVGQLAVRQGQDEVGRVVGEARSQASSLVELFLRGWVSAAEDPFPAEETPAARRPVAEPDPGAPEPTGDPDAPEAATLAIPDYDSLAASQVVSRLAGLSDAELEAVRRYEEAHRGRRTVLGRISQLQG